MDITLTEIISNIFHLHFPAQQQLASTFLRFQEHYESPEFKGKIFTLDEFKQWYILNSPTGKETGTFSYYEDWSGFNIPSPILEPFYEGKFNPLSAQEESLLQLFQDQRGTKFYVIGTSGEEQECLNHEIAHGLFYTNDGYRSKVLENLAAMDPEDKNRMATVLIERGYDQSVLDDEIQAYLVDNLEWLAKHGIKGKGFKKLHAQLRKIYDSYVGVRE